MNPLGTIPLFAITAAAEILGCYLVFVWTRNKSSPWLLVVAAASLGVFAWLLSFHPNAARAYAAYGGVYVACALIWGWVVERQPPDRWDLTGATVCLLGTVIIVFGPR